MPTIGVATDAESRKPVSTHEAEDAPVEYSRLICGSAGTTSVCDRANETPASRSTKST